MHQSFFEITIIITITKIIIHITFHLYRTLDEGDELAFLRVRSKKHEIMIAPDKDYILVVIQNPQEI